MIPHAYQKAMKTSYIDNKRWEFREKNIYILKSINNKEKIIVKDILQEI